MAGQLPGLGDTGLALSENPESAAGFAGFDPVAIAIADNAAADAWAAKLDDLDVPHSSVVEATIGWILSLHDPDGIELQFYSWAHPEFDHVDEPAPGHPTVRRITAPAIPG